MPRFDLLERLRRLKPGLMLGRLRRASGVVGGLCRRQLLPRRVRMRPLVDEAADDGHQNDRRERNARRELAVPANLPLARLVREKIYGAHRL